jgi:hypothetical protein
MKLTYRGLQYDYNPPQLDVTESTLTGCYRGQPSHYHYLNYVPIPQPAEQLTYRGVPYQTNRQGQTVQVVPQQASQMVAATTRQSPLRGRLRGNSPKAAARRQLLQESSQLHQENIARAWEHRLSVAKAQGNDRLIQQLEMEMSHR